MRATEIRNMAAELGPEHGITVFFVAEIAAQLAELNENLTNVSVAICSIGAEETPLQVHEVKP